MTREHILQMFIVSSTHQGMIKNLPGFILAPLMLTSRAHRDTKEIFFLATSVTQKHEETLPLLIFPFSFFSHLVLR